MDPMIEEQMEKWETLDSKVVFDRWVRLVEDRVRLPDGQEATYIVLRGGPGVAVMALTADHRVVLARQYRHPVGEVIDNLPGGGTLRGETLEQAARRELREETGFEAGEVVLLGSFYPSPARASTVVHVFLAKELTEGAPMSDALEAISVRLVPWDDLQSMIARNEIKDVTTIFAVAMAEKRGLV